MRYVFAVDVVAVIGVVDVAGVDIASGYVLVPVAVVVVVSPTAPTAPYA